MSFILIPSEGPESWKQFLAQPERQWVQGYSARTLAYCWEQSRGLPMEVAAILEPVVGPLRPLMVIPERKTALPGGKRESQSDAFLLARTDAGLLACTIEGKVDEPFGPTVTEQMNDASPGKQTRLRYLCDRLGLEECPGDIHYQLLHRSVSALIEAENFCAAHAAMIVHSFSAERRWFDAFERFLALLGHPAAVEPGTAVTIKLADRDLILGWACGDQRFRTM